jgi:hypothetical protein
VIRQDGAIVGEHRRRFARGATIYDPWHYVPVLARKPGALRNGAPFKDWLLPASLERIRRKLQGSDDGDRQMVKVLSAVDFEPSVPRKPSPQCSQATRISREGPMVCRLAGGGKRIRTAGPTCDRDAD